MEYILGGAIFLLGLAMGSFLNLVADRLSNDQPITGRSRCDTCHRTLQWSELLPIVSYFIQKRRCRGCKTVLSWSYPLTELLTGCAFLLTYVFFPSDFFSYVYPTIGITEVSLVGGGWIFAVVLALMLVIVSCLITIVIADLKYFIIPDQVQLVLAGAALVLIGLSVAGAPSWKQLGDHLLAALLIMLPMLILFLITRGRGMGFGDVKLAVSIGLLLGLRGGIATLYVAFLTGTVVGVALMLLRHYGMRSMVPFGPFLVLGMAAVIWWYRDFFLIFQYYFYWY